MCHQRNVVEGSGGREPSYSEGGSANTARVFQSNEHQATGTEAHAVGAASEDFRAPRRAMRQPEDGSLDDWTSLPRYHASET